MKIVILSRNPNLYSTSRLVEAAKKRNHTVQVIDPLKCEIIIEKKNPRIMYRGKYIDDVDAIIPRIGSSVTFYGTAVVRQFEMMKVFSTVESQALVRSRDKLRSLQVLSRAGLGMPKTVFANYTKDVAEVIEYVGGAPLVIKLLEGTQGLGVVLAETNNAAESVVDGTVVGAMKRQGKEGEFRSNLHRGGSAQIIELTDEEENAALKAAKALGLGICGVDLLQSSRGPLILEVNSSPGLEGIEAATKKDIAQSIIRYIERNV